MALDEILLRGSAWLSLLGWAASEWLRPAPSRERRARGLYTAGLIALLAHSALAFHLRYRWNHAAAAADTARQTEAVTGLTFAGGLLVNELFLLLWSADAAWWWRDAASYRARPRALEWAVRAFFLTMFVSGAVVFAHGPARLAGAAATAVVAWTWYRGAGRGPGIVHG
jgi:hypothetical protein